MFTGPDVSEHQGDVDWKRVSSDHELAIVRVSDGDHRDPFYTEGRVKAARAAGLLLAPYYFARVASPQNNERDGAAEAAMVLGFAKSRGWKWPGDLPLIYDFETNNAQPNQKCARHVVQFVRAYKKSEGHYPGLYTMPGFWTQINPHLSKSERGVIKQCFLHQAEWEVDQPRPLEPWDGAAIWQWTDSASCPGVRGGVDMNRSLTSERNILALAKRDRPPTDEREAEEPPKPDAEPDRPADVPRWLERKYWPLWQKPWDNAAANSSKFRALCWEHGFASPHFERKEAACHDAQNSPVPANLRSNAQRQAFMLERLRHTLGDKPLPILSWFRTPAHNKAVGGATQSRHMQADAADFTVQTVSSFGAGKFDAACEKVYANGGFGRYPSGSRHGDARGTRARW